MDNVKDEHVAEQVEAERIPIESPETELANITSVGDPDVMLAIMEKKAELAPRFKAARDTILASQTFARDWTVMGGVGCLSSAGAERVGTLFDIKFFEVTSKKEKFTDSIGEGYRYVYQGKAAMGNSVTFAQGIYGTRDKFLGFKDKEYRPIEEINERDIMQAAYHIFKGNAVKELLGIRQIPQEELEKIMGKAGQDPQKKKSYNHGSGTQGGTTAGDTAKQKELAELCIGFAQAGQFPVKSEDGKSFELKFGNDQQMDMETMELAKAICVELSGFDGKDGTVKGKGAKDLKGKWLETTLKKAQTIKGGQRD